MRGSHPQLSNDALLPSLIRRPRGEIASVPPSPSASSFRRPICFGGFAVKEGFALAPPRAPPFRLAEVVKIMRLLMIKIYRLETNEPGYDGWRYLKYQRMDSAPTTDRCRFLRQEVRENHRIFDAPCVFSSPSCVSRAIPVSEIYTIEYLSALPRTHHCLFLPSMILVELDRPHPSSQKIQSLSLSPYHTRW